MEKKELPQKVVRSIVVSLASAEEIYNSLSTENKSVSILRFYIGVKGDGKEKRYTLLGGKVNPHENVSEAILREINEEASLTPLGIPRQTIIGQWNYSSDKSGERNIFLTYNPLIPYSKIGQIIIGDQKIRDVKIISLEELKKLIEDGHLNGVPIEKHLALGNYIGDKIDITEENSKQRDLSMSKMLLWMTHIEEYLRKRIKNIIIKNGIFISQEQFNIEYEKLLSEFIKKGFEVAVKRKRIRDKEKEQEESELIKALNSGYLGKDILYFMPQLAKYGLSWSGLENATEGVNIFVRFLKGIFTDFIKQQELTEIDFQNLMEDQSVLLNRKINQINSLNEFFRERLKETFGIDDNDLDVAMSYVQNFYRDLSNELKIADPSLTKGLYQDFILLNEVNNANYGYLLSLFMGFDTKISNPEVDELIRFETGRQLILLLKSLAGIKYYNNELNKLKNGRLQHALNAFFGPVVGEQIVNLDKDNKMRVRIRKKGDQLFIIDEKPTKSFTSFLRKTFEEKIEDIHDFYSVSIVFFDGNQNLNRVDELINEFQMFVESKFQSCHFSIKDRRSYGTNDYLTLKSESNQNIVENKGKRIGSQSNRLIRTKLIFCLDDENVELVIYPLFSVSSDRKINKKFWGWLEKIIDDRNYVVKRLLAGEKGIPSMYDLLFPSNLYPHHYQHKLGSSYYN